MLESSQATHFVNLVNFVDFVRTCSSLKFPLRERKISHKAHKVHKIAGNRAPDL
jgi:hypothetical protein